MLTLSAERFEEPVMAILSLQVRPARPLDFDNLRESSPSGMDSSSIFALLHVQVERNASLGIRLLISAALACTPNRY